jgi:LuxR family maltose regulon positive regulatory protein
MDAGGPSQIVAAESHLIKRPRLTKLLDQSGARIILLIAPAGYGKTTLAREWLSSRKAPYVWHSASSSSQDIATLALALGRAAEAIVAGASARMKEAVLAAAQSGQDPACLADVFGEVLIDAPAGTCLAIDDFQSMDAAHEAEVFLRTLLDITELRLLITSRRRPDWIRSRDLVYGNAVELGSTDLAMTTPEAHRLFGERRSRKLDKFVESAGGWPAVLALAVSSSPGASVPHAPADRLYEFFAEELLGLAHEPLRSQLYSVSIPGRLTNEIATAVLGDATESVLSEAMRLGFIQYSGDEPMIHPLLRDFMHKKLAGSPNSRLVAREVGRRLAAAQLWDSAFDVAIENRDGDLLERILSEGGISTIDEGRIKTAETWLEEAASFGIVCPAADVMRAELLLRRADLDAAQRIAVDAAQQLGTSSPLQSRSLLVAGRAAYLRDELAPAYTLYRRARSSARSVEDQREALHGLIATGIEIEAGDLDRWLSELELVQPRDAHTIVRIAGARLMLASARGDLPQAIGKAADALPFARGVSDPFARSAFLNQYSVGLALNGRYDTALEIATEGLEYVRASRLEFARPYLHLRQAIALMGLRHFARAARIITHEEEAAYVRDDPYVRLSYASARVRLLTAQRLRDQAVSVAIDTDPNRRPKIIYGEYLASLALANACGGNFDAAEALIHDARAMCFNHENESLCRVADTIVRLGEDVPDTQGILAEMLNWCLTNEYIDALICGLRGSPMLANAIAARKDLALRIRSFIERTGDDVLLKTLGLSSGGAGSIAVSRSGLTPRELEVLQLVHQGYRNREIAKALFITDVTVKVHLRHIYEKLGVRSRTEAVVRAASLIERRAEDGRDDL